MDHIHTKFIMYSSKYGTAYLSSENQFNELNERASGGFKDNISFI